MIVFHEGLPGSGKSYEACASHILPALTSGRMVYTNIKGINHKKFSELSNLPLPIVERMLICFHDNDLDKQRQSILQTPKNALLIIDEIQDLYPVDRKKLDDQTTVFVTQHRHLSVDIILMGQDRRDVHALWRRRIQRVITFLKLDAVGASKSYRWILFEAVRPEKFKEVSKGVKKYDSKYFGLYASYEEGAELKSSYVDKRGNILKTKGFTVYLPLFIIVFVYACFHLYGFFYPDIPQDLTVKTENVSTVPVKNVTQQQANVKPVKPEYVPVDIFDKSAHDKRLRLSAYIVSEHRGMLANVDLIDSSGHVFDTFTLLQLRQLGWVCQLYGYGLQISKGKIVYVARAFPLSDNYGRVNRTTRETL